MNRLPELSLVACSYVSDPISATYIVHVINKEFNMLSYRTGPSDQGFHCLWVTLDGVGSLEINLNDFFKEKNYLDTLYLHTDLYIKTLPAEAQQEIFAIFQHNFIREDSQSYGSREVVASLELEVKRLVELMDYPRWKAWFRLHQDKLLIPETVNSDFTFDPDMGTTKEKTYIYDEYVDLVALIVFIRGLSPIYVEYFNYSKQVSAHPCYILFRLFVESELDYCPEVVKLRTYIDVNQQTLMGTNKNEHLIIGAGLSDDDMLDCLVAEVIFNKLLTIDFFNKKCNIVSFIFQTIKHKGNFVTSESSSIRTVSNRGENGREDQSYFEDYRKTSSISIGTAVEIQESLNNPVHLAFDLGYKTFDFEAYNEELKNVQQWIVHPPENVQIYLLGWFLSRAINPRALFYIERRKLAELLIFAKVALSKTNLEFIGAIMCSVKQTDTQFLQVVFRNSLNKNLLKRLKRHYKYAIDDDKASVVERTIWEVGKEINNNVWLPIGTINNRQLLTQEGFLNVPGNINDVICSFVDFVLDQEHSED